MGVRIGKNVFLGKYCIIDDTFPELITIEDNVIISFGATIITHDDSRGIVAPVRINKEAFLGTRSVILPGVIIGEKSIVGAGAVVTKDVPVNSTVVGSPAHVIKRGAEKINSK
jgi:acetyltransferase-like isoleucine patch superfamily enzyme